MKKDFYNEHDIKNINIFSKQHKTNNEMNLEVILNIQKEINIQGFGNFKSFFSKTKFFNKSTESKFNAEKDKFSFHSSKSEESNIINNNSSSSNFYYNNSSILDSEFTTNFIFILGYLINIMYLFVAYFNTFLVYLCLIFKIISLIIILVLYCFKKKPHSLNKKILKYFDQALIFLSSIYLNLKILMISIVLNTETLENSEMLIRIIIFQYLSTNLYLLIKLEANIKINIFYFLKDTIFIIIAHVKSKQNHFYFMEISTSFWTYLTFYIFRKIWDLERRNNYAEKLKFRNLSIYVNDLINGLKGYHFNLFDEKFISYNEKFKKLINKNSNESNYEDLIQKCSKTDTENLDEILINKKILNYFEKKNYFSLKNNLNQNETFQNNDILNEEFKINIFLKKLKLFDANRREVNSLDISDKDKNTEIKKENELEMSMLKKNNTDIEISEKKIKKDNLFYIIQNLIKNLCKKEFEEDSNIQYLGVFHLEKKRLVDKKRKKFVKESSKNISKFDLSQDISTNNERAFLKSRRTKNSLILEKNILEKNEENYFDIFFRKVNLLNGKVVYNVIFYDVTDLIQSKNKIIKEDFQKTRIFAKIAHEFKTPLNSIQSIIENLTYQDKNEIKNTLLIPEKKTSLKFNLEEKTLINNHVNLNKNTKKSTSATKEKFSIKKTYTKKNCDQLSIASNLLICLNFLVSDIITFSNLSNLNQLNIRNEYLNLSEIISSSKKILETLLYLSKSKSSRITPEIIIDSSVKFELDNQTFVKSDEFRIKQILYNFISNSVKFTNNGKITLEIKIIEFESSFNEFFTSDTRNFEDIHSVQKEKINEGNNKYLSISIIDTGIGIDPKKRLDIFESNNEPEIKDKKIDDIFKIKGFGLIICKFIANILNIKIGFVSELNQGSKFYMYIPFTKQNHIYVNKCNTNVYNFSYFKNATYVKRLPFNERSPEKLNEENKERHFKISKSNTNLLKVNLNVAEIYEKTNKNNNNLSLTYLNDKINTNKINLIQEGVYSNLQNNQLSYSSQRNKTFKIEKSQNDLNDFIFDENCDFENSTIVNGNINFEKNNKVIKLKYSQSCNSSSFENTSFRILNKGFVLVVDDNHLINDANKNIVNKCFEKVGIKIEIILCSDGIDVVRHILNENIKKNIKCVITDENMEYINGSEAIKFIRKLESKFYIHHIPCISVTSHEDKNIIDNIYASGANHVLSKPLNMTSLSFLLQDFEF